MRAKNQGLLIGCPIKQLPPVACSLLRGCVKLPAPFRMLYQNGMTDCITEMNQVLAGGRNDQRCVAGPVAGRWNDPKAG